MRRVVIAVLLLATGCGAGGGGSLSAKAVYLRKAEAVCAAANGQEAQAKKDTPTSVAAVPAYVHRFVDIARQDVSALSALVPPKPDAADITSRLLTPLAQQLADGEAYAKQVDAAAAAHDTGALTSLVLNPPTKTRVDVGWMRRYGFRECVTAADTGAATK